LLRRIDPVEYDGHGPALRKTAIPAVIVLLLLAAAGAIMQAAVPEAITTGDFLRAVL
jgi:hypothetical protein